MTATTRPFCAPHRPRRRPRGQRAPAERRARRAARAAGPPPAPPGRPFVVGYAGNLGIAQGLGIVLDAAERLRDASVRFVLVGDGPVGGAPARAQARAAVSTNVEFRPASPSREVGALPAGLRRAAGAAARPPAAGRLHPVEALRRDGGRPPGDRRRRGRGRGAGRSDSAPAWSCRPRTARRWPRRSRARRRPAPRRRASAPPGRAAARDLRALAPGRAPREVLARRAAADRRDDGRPHVRHRRRLRPRRARPRRRAGRAPCATRMRHRGPDDEGLWTSTEAATSCSATAGSRIVDLVAAGRQPDGQRGRLGPGHLQRRDLQPRGAARRTSRRAATASAPAATPRCSSTSTRSTGADMVDRLVGMFAFAIWDERRERLFAGPRPARHQAALLARRRRARSRSPRRSRRCCRCCRAARSTRSRSPLPDVRRRPAAAHAVRGRLEARAGTHA